jgi:preprotein translocase subunit YajC
MGTQQQGYLTIALYFGMFLAIFYIFIVMPRKKQEKKHKETLASLKRGDKVVTIGGIRGEISKIMDDAILIKINDNTEIEFLKNAIAYKVEGK